MMWRPRYLGLCPSTASLVNESSGLLFVTESNSRVFSVLEGVSDTPGRPESFFGGDVRSAMQYQKVGFWVDELKRNEPDCVVYIVGTKGMPLFWVLALFERHLRVGGLR